MYMMFVPHKKHTYGPPRPIMGILLLFLYVDDVRASQEAYGPPQLVAGILFILYPMYQTDN
jgi:hypothetical protein